MPGKQCVLRPMAAKIFRRALRLVNLEARYIRYRNRHHQPQVIEGPPREIFTKYYLENKWGDKESLSGPGSNLKYTENLRNKLPELVDHYNISTMLDAPCGDFHWFQHIRFNQPLDYIGADIVEPMIEKLQKQYTNEHRQFQVLDITADPLPDVDLWMCRDCLFHLSDEMIYKALANYLKSDIPYLFTTTFPQYKENPDIVTGSSRRLNLQADPFNFPPPLLKIDDWIEGFPERYIALWEKAQVQQAMADNPHFQKITMQA